MCLIFETHNGSFKSQGGVFDPAIMYAYIYGNLKWSQRLKIACLIKLTSYCH